MKKTMFIISLCIIILQASSCKKDANIYLDQYMQTNIEIHQTLVDTLKNPPNAKVVANAIKRFTQKSKDLLLKAKQMRQEFASQANISKPSAKIISMQKKFIILLRESQKSLQGLPQAYYRDSEVKDALQELTTLQRPTH